jgi:hypothetical protein
MLTKCIIKSKFPYFKMRQILGCYKVKSKIPMAIPLLQNVGKGEVKDVDGDLFALNWWRRRRWLRQSWWQNLLRNIDEGIANDVEAGVKPPHWDVGEHIAYEAKVDGETPHWNVDEGVVGDTKVFGEVPHWNVG